jgi:hypothetical protein
MAKSAMVKTVYHLYTRAIRPGRGQVKMVAAYLTAPIGSNFPIIDSHSMEQKYATIEGEICYHCTSILDRSLFLTFIGSKLSQTPIHAQY